jgi:hypothetical protein
MLDRTWDNFDADRWRENSALMWPAPWMDEPTCTAERLREAERRITRATGWDSSTVVVGRVLDGLDGERDER